VRRQRLEAAAAAVLSCRRRRQLEVATAAAVSRVLWKRQLETGEGLL
jgi:hypothetical protein